MGFFAANTSLLEQVDQGILHMLDVSAHLYTILGHLCAYINKMIKVSTCIHVSVHVYVFLFAACGQDRKC